MLKSKYALFLFFSIVAIGVTSCFKETKYKGYTQTRSGLYYKLQAIGDGKNKPTDGDLLQLSITYKTENDSVFLETAAYNETGMVILPFKHSSFKGSFEEGLTTMNEGDSVSFIVRADSLFTKFFKSPVPYFFVGDSMVKMDVKLHKILDKEHYVEELVKYGKLIEDRDIEEQRKLRTYLDTTKINYVALKNGMYYCSFQQGAGEKIKAGDSLKINYTGYFLSGRKFESTRDRNQPMEFTYGDQGQVIKGIETAISLMKQGEKAKFIIPSQLAYGMAGSSTGIIPPYTTVIYEIELLKLN